VTYLFQCVSGFQDLVARELAHSLAGPTRVLAVEEGFLVVDAAAPPGELRKLGFVNNSFLVIGEGADPLDVTVRRWLEDRDWQAAAARAVTPHERSFRLVFHDAGQLVSAPPGTAEPAAQVLARATGLRRNPHRADAEFWFIRRASGRTFFAKRLSHRARTERDLEPGELRPELADLLCRLSEPARGDVFLDPFAGSGAIPAARATRPYNMIFCLESDPERLPRLKARMKAAQERSSPIIVRAGDARRLERLDDGFVHKVVTDPPWGLHDRSISDLPGFYREVVHELCRVTGAGGLVVMLLGRRDLADQLSAEFSGWLALAERHDILVAGKKAVALKWRRTVTPAAASG
jgi:predicted RNA methylase